MNIRELTINELQIVEDIARKTWPVCYKHILTAGQIDYMLNWMYSQQKLQKDYNNDLHFHALEIEGKTVGFTGHGFTMKEAGIYRLEKIYVLPEEAGKGFGKVLLNFVIGQARKVGADVLQLNVNRNNPAIKFYEHLDFVKAREEINDIGNGYVMDDYVMEKYFK